MDVAIYNFKTEMARAKLTLTKLMLEQSSQLNDVGHHNLRMSKTN